MTAFGAGGSVASDGNREAVHHFSFGADLVLFSGLIWYVARAARRAPATQSWLKKWLPLVFVGLGSFLTILDTARHMCLDHGGVICNPKYLYMYADDEGHLSNTGHICHIATILGMVVLFLGVTMFMQLPEKIGRYMGWAV